MCIEARNGIFQYQCFQHIGFSSLSTSEKCRTTCAWAEKTPVVCIVTNRTFYSASLQQENGMGAKSEKKTANGIKLGIMLVSKSGH